MQLHDTYFVSAQWHVLVFMSLFYALLGLLYQYSGEWRGVSKVLALSELIAILLITTGLILEVGERIEVQDRVITYLAPTRLLLEALILFFIIHLLFGIAAIWKLLWSKIKL